jgi:predicted Zn-dependent protease
MWPALRAGVARDEAQEFLRGSLKQETGYGDTHPSLSDRLKALGFDPSAQEALAEEVAREGGDGEPVETAAEHYLGELRGELSRRLDAEWCAGVGPSWRERHEYVTQTRRKLAALEEKAKTKELSDEEAWSRAEWTAEFKGADEAVPLLRELTGRRRTAGAAHALLGQILIAKEDAAGVEHLEKAMAEDPDYVPFACQLIYDYVRVQGREEEAEAYRRRLLKHLDAQP